MNAVIHAVSFMKWNQLFLRVIIFMGGLYFITHFYPMHLVALSWCNVGGWAGAGGPTVHFTWVILEAKCNPVILKPKIELNGNWKFFLDIFSFSPNQFKYFLATKIFPTLWLCFALGVVNWLSCSICHPFHATTEPCTQFYYRGSLPQ